MKKTLISLLGIILLLNLCSTSIHAESSELSQECIIKMKIRNEQRTKLIMKDIMTSFKLDFDPQSYREVTQSDLQAAHILYGGKEENPYYNSLKNLFMVGSIVTPKLFIKPLEGYFLYKEPDNTNVMVKIRLSDSKWEVLEEKKVKGNEIEYKPLKCEKDYLKKRNEG